MHRVQATDNTSKTCFSYGSDKLQSLSVQSVIWKTKYCIVVGKEKKEEASKKKKCSCRPDNAGAGPQCFFEKNVLSSLLLNS